MCNTSLHRISGCTYAPGGLEEQSAYRSKLVGLLALVTMIQAITTFHRISDGQVTVGCDNESALNLAFNTDTPITSSMADHGILSAIRWQLMNTTITWATQHVRGHQDEGVMPTVLTRFETLNCDGQGRKGGTSKIQWQHTTAPDGGHPLVTFHWPSQNSKNHLPKNLLSCSRQRGTGLLVTEGKIGVGSRDHKLACNPISQTMLQEEQTMVHHETCLGHVWGR